MMEGWSNGVSIRTPYGRWSDGVPINAVPDGLMIRSKSVQTFYRLLCFVRASCSRGSIQKISLVSGQNVYPYGEKVLILYLFVLQ